MSRHSQISAFCASLYKCWAAGPLGGNVEISIFYKLVIARMILKLQYVRVFKNSTLDEKKESHLPIVIFKFLNTTPILTLNFETQKNVGDNFYSVYK